MTKATGVLCSRSCNDARAANGWETRDYSDLVAMPLAIYFKEANPYTAMKYHSASKLMHAAIRTIGASSMHSVPDVAVL